MEVQEPLDSFFKTTDKAPDPNGDCILYNLRVDLEKLYGKESELEGDSSSNTMLALTGILIGIDYISQCYFGKQSSTAFIESLIELGGVDWDNAEAIYQLRCALLHSFSLSTVSDRKSFRKGSRFYFKVVNDAPNMAIKMEGASESEISYKINVWGLKKCFTRMIAELELICRDRKHKKHRATLNRISRRVEEKLRIEQPAAIT